MPRLGSYLETGSAIEDLVVKSEASRTESELRCTGGIRRRR